MPPEQSAKPGTGHLLAAFCTGLLVAGDALAQELSGDAMALGESVYQTHCAACHGEAGGGGPGFPPLANSSRLRDDPRMITQILKGAEYMPGFAFLLSDAEVASVSTYIRNSWGNDFGPVTEEQVLELR